MGNIRTYWDIQGIIRDSKEFLGVAGLVRVDEIMGPAGESIVF